MKSPLGNQTFRIWLTIVGVSTLILGAAYTMVQQSTRLSADDQPLVTAQITLQELRNDSNAKDVVPILKTNLRTDAGIFVIVTDDTQHVIASSANLDGRTPLPPRGVFSYTQQHQTDRFTWQPANGVRLATRVFKYQSDSGNTGFIISGQSLKPYEDRITTYTWIALAAWIACIAWSYLLIMLPISRSR